ncbi:MAG: hypothetical protein ACREBD_37765 [Blastocatellia bacterium]
MTRLPANLTHNYDPKRGPFRNICTLSEDEAEHVLNEIRATGKRNLKPDYLPRRLATETWLRAERTRKLGRPRLAHPIYCFLGDLDWVDASRPRSIRIPLAALAREAITFTYPDSMASLPLATHDEHREERRPYHGHVFTLDEIEEVVAAFGLPGAGHGQTASRYDTFIEAQIWDDRPLRDYLPT